MVSSLNDKRNEQASSFVDGYDKVGDAKKKLSPSGKFLTAF